MVNVVGAYCAKGDLRTGDIPLPAHTSAEQYIQSAAEEIDAALGHLYVSPFVIAEVPANRPTILYLKKLNWLLASGRAMLDIAAAGEDAALHAYGKRMLDEAMGMLKPVISEEIVLTGAPKIDGASKKDTFEGPQIFNEDSASLVEGFYVNHRPDYGGVGEPFPFYGYTPPVIPYG